VYVFVQLIGGISQFPKPFPRCKFDDSILQGLDDYLPGVLKLPENPVLSDHIYDRLVAHLYCAARANSNPEQHASHTNSAQPKQPRDQVATQWSTFVVPPAMQTQPQNIPPVQIPSQNNNLWGEPSCHAVAYLRGTHCPSHGTNAGNASNANCTCCSDPGCHTSTNFNFNYSCHSNSKSEGSTKTKGHF
jgi:hypothetical protein